MDIIPVIDLKDGQVVHARTGARQTYLPIRSPLTPDAAPLSVVAGVMGLYPFRRLYVADLDAIAQAGDHARDVDRIAAAYPDLEIWVDSGLSGQAECQAWLQSKRHRLVIGSESQNDPGLPKALERGFGARRVALSLDFRDGRILGPPEILADSEYWPQTIIAMTLARVGSQLGPELSLVQSFKQRASSKHVYGAGGVRGPADLHALAKAGAAGVLVASALHDGRLGVDDLRRFGSP